MRILGDYCQHTLAVVVQNWTTIHTVIHSLAHAAGVQCG